MNITKSLSALSIAFALIGGTVMLAPAPAHAGGNFISFDALKKNNQNKNNNRPGKPANPHNRGCSDITRCKRG